MEQEPKGIREQSAKYPAVQNLMHNVNERTLMAEHRKQSRKKATGVDGIDKAAYDENAPERIAALVERMRKFQYKPLPVRRTYIPKVNGKLRPLGIPAYEDRLVQGVMAKVLNEVYEPRFLGCSYGFRPGKGAHDVVRYINQTIMTKKVNYVLEADIKGFFDNVDHDWLMRFLAHDIQDKNYLRCVERFLIAGIMEDGKRLASDRGTPQGGLISPVLANVYLHYVLDLWMEKAIKPRLRGEVYYVRYADDFLILFQYENEARKVMDTLKKRLGKFSLEVAEDKTRILPIGRFKGTKEDFDFLGFTFFNAKTRSGKYRLGVRTSNEEAEGEATGGQDMAQGTDAQASSGDDENDRFYPPRTLQLLWGKREFSCYTELLEIPEILHLQSAEPPPPEAIHEVQQVSTNLELLCQRAASDHRYLGLATKDYLKSRMRENRTSGSVRGSRQSLRSKNYVKGVSRLSTRLIV